MKIKVKVCRNCGIKYIQDSCPKCQPQEFVPLTTEQHIARMTDTEVKFIFQTFWWEQGKLETRQLCLSEYDKRIGLENWPAHITKGAE